MTLMYATATMMRSVVIRGDIMRRLPYRFIRGIFALTDLLPHLLMINPGLEGAVRVELPPRAGMRQTGKPSLSGHVRRIYA